MGAAQRLYLCAGAWAYTGSCAYSSRAYCLRLCMFGGGASNCMECLQYRWPSIGARVREFVVDDRVHSGLQESGRFAYGGWQIERSWPSTDRCIQLVYGLHGG